ncbi:MAG: outer membrane lipoprotein carrier protein LolA [Flavobacteriales bacterium]
MMKRMLIPALLFLPLTLFAQQEKKAGRILEKLSSKHRSNGAIKAKFTSRMINKKDDVNMERQGSLKMKGNKFVLDMGKQKVYSDGKTRWTFLKESNEVKIKNANKKSTEGKVVHPTDLFTIWEKGYKYEYAKRIKEDGRSFHVIKLYPKKPDEKPFHTIQLKIDKKKEAIHEVRVYGKAGTDYVYVVKDLKENVDLKDETFVFKPSEHPNVKKVDLR